MAGSTGAAGNIAINADAVEVSGFNGIDGSGYRSEISSKGYGAGDAGNVSISARVLTLADSGILSTSAKKGSSGNAGDILVAADRVSISGYHDTPGGRWVDSGIFSSAYGTGYAGGISLETGRFYLGAKGEINVESTGTGTAGDISITAADSVELHGGSSITAATADSDGAPSTSAPPTCSSSTTALSPPPSGAVPATAATYT
ncbi:MAG: hypothetical protein HY894_04215 [Deltaproteobacteria bacterium]|nr:hypothetical protein [Deltaproteobacteria bacterium]